MQYLVLSALVAIVLLFALAPRIPPLRHLLGIPASDAATPPGRPAHQSSPSVTRSMPHPPPTTTAASSEVRRDGFLQTVSGFFVRVSAPEHDPLWRPETALLPSPFQHPIRPTPLFAASDLATASADVLRGMLLRGIRLSDLANDAPLQRVSRLRVEELPVLDLTDRLGVALLGLTLQDAFSRDVSRVQKVAEVAREVGAEGLVIPAQFSPGASHLAVFTPGMHRVHVVETQLIALQIAHATPDATLEGRFTQDEQLVRDFAEALDSDRFEDWLASLSLPVQEIASMRSLADAVYPTPDPVGSTGALPPDHPADIASQSDRPATGLDPFTFEMLEQEANRLDVPLEELMRFSVLYYLADSDSGRVARAIDPQSSAVRGKTSD